MKPKKWLYNCRFCEHRGHDNSAGYHKCKIDGQNKNMDAGCNRDLSEYVDTSVQRTLEVE